MARRVLFLSLSGVRIVDEELRRLGLSLPGFIERGKTIAALPSLGLLILAAHTPSTWDVEYRELDEIAPGEAGRIAQEGWDLIAISALSARIDEAYGLADQLRMQGTCVVLGGLHISALPGEAGEHADAVVVGQGEDVWGQVLSDLENRRLKPHYEAHRSVRVLKKKDRPLPRYDLLDPARYNRIPLQTMRGCPLDCSFCGASRTISDYQLAPLERVERELELIASIWSRPFIELADDNTFASPERGKKLAKLLQASGVRWFTETDISVARSDALLDALAESGCAQLLIGLESSQRSSLRGVDSGGFKWREAEHYARSIERIQSRGISVNGCFVLGHDEDDESIFEQTLKTVRELSLSEVQLTLLTPFPGTPLARGLQAQGRLLREKYWDQCTLFDVTYRPAKMSEETLRAGFRWLMAEVYRDEEVTGRKRKFAACVRQRKATAPQVPLR
jgi:radical SAM superfamily enzyme YgiQ (UPF0313 family)